MRSTVGGSVRSGANLQGRSLLLCAVRFGAPPAMFVLASVVVGEELASRQLLGRRRRRTSEALPA